MFQVSLFTSPLSWKECASLRSGEGGFPVGNTTAAADSSTLGTVLCDCLSKERCLGCRRALQTRKDFRSLLVRNVFSSLPPLSLKCLNHPTHTSGHPTFLLVGGARPRNRPTLPFLFESFMSSQSSPRMAVHYRVHALMTPRDSLPCKRRSFLNKWRVCFWQGTV